MEIPNESKNNYQTITTTENFITCWLPLISASKLSKSMASQKEL